MEITFSAGASNSSNWTKSEQHKFVMQMFEKALQKLHEQFESKDRGEKLTPITASQSLLSYVGIENEPKLTPYSSLYLPPEYAKIYEPAYLRPLCDWCSTMSNGLKNPDIKISKLEFKNIPLYAAGSTKGVCYGFAI